MAKTPTWQRAEGKNPEGGLNEKGRASLRAAGHDIKRPQPEGGSRRDSFCARMKGMKAKLTSKETANDPDSRINKSLRKWNCADGGAVDPYDAVQHAAKGGEVWDKPRPKKLGKPEPLSSKEKKSAKAAAKAAGRPYPNLIDNMRAARADGGEADPYDAVQNAANTDALPSNFSAEDIQRASHGATPAVPTLSVTENVVPSTPAADSLRSAYNAAIPPTARLLAEGAMGIHTPITEADFSQSDIQNMKDRLVEQQQLNAEREKNLQDIQNFMTPEKYRHYQAMTEQPITGEGDYRRMMQHNAEKLQSFQNTRGQTSVPYGTTFGKEDQPNQPLSVYSNEQGGIANAINRSYNDPGYRTGMTLGRFNVYDTPQGRIAIDNYDFRGTKQSLSDIAHDFQTKPGVTALRGAIPTLLPNIERPVAINLDKPGNYTYTGKPILTPGSHLDPEQTQTPRQDEIADYRTKTPGFWQFNKSAQESRTPNVTALIPPRRPASFADGGEVDDRAHEFIQEQLKSDEPQAPQYVAENDFPARAARGVEAVDTAASKVNNLLANVAGQPAMRSPEGRTASEVVQSAMPVDPYQAVQQAATQWREGDKLGAAETMAAGMPMQGAIRAYHGSPHKFDRFDISKIGTGEGAQAYGHGLYFADSEGVAKSYRDALSHKADPRNAINDLVYQFTQGKVAAPTSENIKRFMSQDDFMKPYAENPSIMARIREIIQGQEPGGSVSDQAMHSYRELEHLLPEPSKGHMYEVELGVEPNQLLDWDKTLGKQSQKVRSVIEDKFPSHMDDPRSSTGQGLYKELVRDMGRIGSGSQRPEAFISDVFRHYGVPGIQYLDAGSRVAGEGSRNYVIFDPSLIDIKRRYADGGQVEGDVQFADDDPYAKVQESAKLPMMAQNDFAMRMPQPEVRYDTGPQPGEATLKGYDPTIKERIYQGIAGTEERPSPERAQFARGMSQMAEFAPVLGNVMAGQEAQRRGDTKGMLMAALPVPGMATEARMAEAAISPAQEAAREAYQRVLNAQGLYSHAAEAAYNLPQAKGSYEQMMAMLQKAGVKPEEMRWSGVEQFAGQPVTREQLASHFEQNVPKIEETVLGSPDETKLNEADAAVREAIRAYNEGQVAPRYYATNPERIYSSSFFPTREEAAAHILTLPKSYRAGTTVEEFPGKPIDVYETMRRLHNGEFVYNLPPGVNRAALNLIDERNALAEAAEQSGTKFGQYTLPGGQNYREVLLHQPPSWEPKIEEKYGRFGFVGPDNKFRDYWTRSEAEQAARSFKRTSGDFTSQHWDQPNVLGHLRMSDRTGPEGEKILHLEELQSDWGQAGRKEGFETKEMKEAKDKASKEFNDYSKKLAEKYDLNPNHNLAMYGRLKNMDPSEVGKYEELQRIASEAGAFKSKTIPSAPYVEKTQNWVDLGLKRALKEAAEGGYSKMVWTPGEEQAARYQLSKHIDDLTYLPSENRLIGRKNGEDVFYKEVMPKDLDNYVGKDIASKLLETKPISGVHRLSGQELTIGGEGMKGFYDKIVPSRLKELLKKIDPQAKMSFTDLQTRDGIVKVPTLEITPKIREAVKRGLPAYAKGGEVVNNDDPYDNIRLKAKNFPRARRASH